MKINHSFTRQDDESLIIIPCMIDKDPFTVAVDIGALTRGYIKIFADYCLNQREALTLPHLTFKLKIEMTYEIDILEPSVHKIIQELANLNLITFRQKSKKVKKQTDDTVTTRQEALEFNEAVIHAIDGRNPIPTFQEFKKLKKQADNTLTTREEALEGWRSNVEELRGAILEGKPMRSAWALLAELEKAAFLIILFVLCVK